jgi:hypothetical protein
MRFQVASTERSAALRSKVFELGEDLLDWIEIGTVGRQEEQAGAGCANGTAHGALLVAAQIVDNDDVAGLERGKQRRAARKVKVRQ